MTRSVAYEITPDFDAGLKIAEYLFGEIAARTSDGIGVTRASYGESEQIAHDIVTSQAEDLGLEVDRDAALNSYMTAPGRDRGKPRIIVGSHLDSVRNGGNFDGLAGVVAGLACLAGFGSAGIQPTCDVTVMAIRSEENFWFRAQHVGSRAALGLLTRDVLETATRSDTQRTLREHMVEAGAELSPIIDGQSLLDRTKIGCFLECHIEQGPILVNANHPIGIVSAIRGHRRCQEVVCVGAYGHSGAEPRASRRDAVFAASELVMRMDELWTKLEDRGEDAVITFGKFSTDPAAHGLTVIPGEVSFSVDVRSHSAQTLESVWSQIHDVSRDIASRRGVEFKFAPTSSEWPAQMDLTLRRLMKKGCRELGIPGFEIASGGGHDAGDFAQAGIPTGMIFIRNAEGSHNPHESMELPDFGIAVRLLSWVIERIAEEALD